MNLLFPLEGSDRLCWYFIADVISFSVDMNVLIGTSII